MGYYVSSVMSVTPNDHHSYFVYFVPAGWPYSFSTAWIDEWVVANFTKFARAIGPSGMAVSSLKGAEQRFRDDVLQIVNTAFNTEANKAPRDSSLVSEYDFLHAPFPFLIVSRIPLQRIENSGDAIVMNLAMFEDQPTLERFFDQLSASIRSDSWDAIIETFPDQQDAGEPAMFGGFAEMINKLLELKPNLFGVGVNLNNALTMIGRKLSERTKGGRN